MSTLKRVDSILSNEAVYRLAEVIPRPHSFRGGRKRDFPDYMLIVYETLISVYGSARQVEAEISHPVVWRFMRKKVKRTFPDEASMHLPRRPMRRHHYLYGRNRYLTCPEVLEEFSRLHRLLASEQATRAGLLKEDGAGSWTHPELSRMLYADGKVITPLFKGRSGQTRVDRATGEIKQVRHEPDADLHFEGTGETAYGTKFVIVAARDSRVRSRMILDIEWVADKGGEASVAMDCFRRLTPCVPGAQGVIYDTALRGVHHQTLLRELGLLPLNRVTAAVKGSKTPRRKEGRRVEKTVHVEDKIVRNDAGGDTRISLFARGGAIGIVELDETGEPLFSELRRIRTHRSRDKSGLYRWYNDFALPAELGGQTITVRLHGNEEDTKRKFNRTENVRPIPPSDHDFKKLYARRNDAESINRSIDDSMWLSRAHSVGHLRQKMNLLGYALMVNSLTLHEHEARGTPERQAA
ncbi:MAG: hypothetical protein M3198_09780 [Actinomycetota bacterium]|nr:hypothetical protein [Actinomycetota bacterium]